MSTGHGLPTGTVTMLFTDIEGSTRLLKQLGDRYGELLSDHRRLLREAFAAHGGREMDTQGDAFFVAFGRAREAVEAAVDGQRALAAYEWPEGVECRVRMGLHTGEPSVGDEGYHGIGLHRGARIAGTARGGQILLSSATAELVQDDLPAGVSMRDLGKRQLKDIDRPEHVYQLQGEGLPSEFLPSAKPVSKRPRRRVHLAAASGILVVAAVIAGVLLGTHGGSGPATAADVSANSVGIFRPGNGGLTGQISVGASPSAVAAGDDSVWVANVDAHSVSQIDPIKGVTIQTIQVGNGPAGIAIGGGFVWVTNSLDGTVSQISLESESVVNTIDVGNGPVGVAADAHDVWVANSSDGTVTEIDDRTDKPRATISVGQSADGIALGQGSIWVTSQLSGTVTRIDASGNVVATLATGSGAGAVATAPDAVWVANSLDGTVTRVDPTSNTVRAVIPVGDGPSGIAVTGANVWVSNALAGTLKRIDTVRDAVAQTVRTGNQPEGIVVTSGQMFVAVRASGVGHGGGMLRVETSYTLPSLDPAMGSEVLVYTNDGLTGFRRVGGSAGTTLVPDLAVSLPVPTNNGRLYTFQLRPGIRYSSGALVQPQDFRVAIERSLVLDSVEAAYYADIAGARECLAAPKKPCDLSKGIVADAASNTVTFRLTAADPNFLYALALPTAYAVPAGTALHPHLPLPATGPYRVASFDPKRGIRLVRNPKFHEWSQIAQPSGFPDAIVERYAGSPDAHVSAVLHGSADLASDPGLSPSPAVLASLKRQHPNQLEINPWASSFILALNTRAPPFNDLRVRQALNFAIDRAHLRDITVGPGLGRVTCQILPPDFPGFRPYCPYTADPSQNGVWRAPDLARARELVRDSGTAGQAITVWIPDFGPFGEGGGRYVVSVLDSLGYKARLHPRNPNVNPFLAEDKLHLQLGFYGWLPDFAAPAGFIPPALTCAAYNRDNSENEAVAEFCDPAIDREIARAEQLQTSDPESASHLWAKVDRDLTDQAPWVPFANGIVLEVISTRVGNYQYNPQLGTLLDQLWVH